MIIKVTSQESTHPDEYISLDLPTRTVQLIDSKVEHDVSSELYELPRIFNEKAAGSLSVLLKSNSERFVLFGVLEFPSGYWSGPVSDSYWPLSDDLDSKLHIMKDLNQPILFVDQSEVPTKLGWVV